MGKKNRASTKTEKPKTSFQDQLKISDIVKEILSKSSQIGPMNKSEEWENYLSIYGLLQQLITLQKSPAPVGGAAGRAERLARLHAWLLEHGGAVHGLQPAVHGEYGWGLTCTRALAEGEPAIEVPRALMMTLETARASRLGGLLATDKLTRALPQLGLTLHLLEESLTEQSRWAPYVHALPDQYDTVLYFTPDEIQLLKGSPCFDEAVKQCRNIARQYAYYHGFLHHCPEARSLALRDNFTYERYRWAASTVMTRMNNIPSLEDPSQGVPGLIPFWDLCNHANGRVSTDYSQEEVSSVCYASRNFAAGEQFFIFYGVRPNAEFLLHNGFVYRDNEHDAVAVRLGVSRGDALHERRARLLERLGVPASGVFYLHREGAPIDASLLAFLRVFNMDSDGLDQWLQADNVSELGADCCPGLPDGLEAAAWRFLHTRVGLLLRLYPGPASDDRRLLADQSARLTGRGRMAVTLRLGEKEILERALQYARQRME